MYILRKPVAIIGMIGALASCFLLPYLKVPIKGSWSLYQTDMSLFVITLVLIVLCIFFFFMRKITLYRIISRLFLSWTILALLAVYFKINNYFGMKLVDGLLAKTLHLRWGWIVLIASAFMMTISVKKLKDQ